MTLRNTDRIEAIQTSSWTALLDDNHRIWCFDNAWSMEFDNGVNFVYAVYHLFSHARDRHMNQWRHVTSFQSLLRIVYLREGLSARKTELRVAKNNVNLFTISLDVINIMHFYSDYPRYSGFLIARTRRLRCSCTAMIVFWEESYCHALILCQTSHAR